MLCLTYQNNQGEEDFESRMRAVARTSVGGVGYDQDMQLARVGDDRFLDAVVILQSGINTIMNKRIKTEARRFLARTDIKNRIHGTTVDQERLGSEIIGKSLGRLPFVTRKGHLVLGSEYVKQGDLVALIKGAQVPFVLRRHCGEAYQLIGEAFVDGIMDGEAAEDSEFREIVLV